MTKLKVLLSFNSYFLKKRVQLIKLIEGKILLFLCCFCGPRLQKILSFKLKVHLSM